MQRAKFLNIWSFAYPIVGSWTCMKICRINFGDFDYVECKIFAFTVNKLNFFAPCYTRLYDFEVSLLKISILKIKKIYVKELN